MKKHYYLGLAVASMLLATSCSQEEDFGQQSSGELTTFSVSLDGATNSRAAGEGTNVNELVYEVRNSSDEIVIDETVEMNGSSATVEMALVKGEEYKIIFWAQNDENGVYTTKDLTAISVDYSNVNSNLDKLDAFYNGFEYTADGKQHRVELRRPFAQLNVGTSSEDWSKAQSLGVTVAKSKVEISVGALATTFNAFSGEALDATTATVTFNANNVIAETFKVNDVTYQSLAMNYLLVPGVQAPDGLGEHAEPAEGESVAKTTVDQINVTFYKADDDEIYTLSVPNAPIQRNYRTNIIGNLLSGDTDVFDVVVVPDFDGDNNYSELELVMANGGEITLNEDITVSSSLVVSAGKEVIINLNGKTITNTSTDETFGVGEAIISYGKLTINGEGTVKANSMAVWARGADNAEITINGGTFIGMAEGLAKGGRSVVYASSGNTINIYGGTFEALAADKTSFADKTNGVYAALNIADNNGYINVYGGTFKNFDPSKPGTEPSGWNTTHVKGFVAEGYKVESSETVYLVVPEGNTAVFTTEDLQKALSNNTTINLAKGVYTLPTMKDYEGITLIGTEGTVIGGESATTGFGSNFGKDTTIKNVTFSGSTNGVRYSYANGGTTTFDNCTFAGDATYGFHIDSSNGATFIFNDCTFSGFNAFASDLVSVTFNNCTFKHNGNYGHTNIWSKGYFNNCTWEDNTSVGTRGDNAHLYFNNVEESYMHTYIGSAESLFAFAESVNGSDNKSWQGQSILLVADIDLENKTWTPIGQTGATEFKGIFDGQNHTIRNLNIDSSEQTDGYYSSGLFGWIESHGQTITIKNVKVDGATVKGHHNVAVIAGYLEGDSKVENCHVANATLLNIHANDNACGDKAGCIAGYVAAQVTISGCTAKDSKITAGRDAGQLIGASYVNLDNSNCSASNVIVSIAEGCTGANIANELVGRKLYNN